MSGSHIFFVFGLRILAPDAGPNGWCKVEDLAIVFDLLGNLGPVAVDVTVVVAIHHATEVAISGPADHRVTTFVCRVGVAAVVTIN
jgi:hypothetical protein